ncbi:hypothetical protein HDU93_008201 [Gonapodya sp. JEL0774]|nr:hypothetical protein HDU93_008201 [Gonapodya sp. JEL0774]
MPANLWRKCPASCINKALWHLLYQLIQKEEETGFHATSNIKRALAHLGRYPFDLKPANVQKKIKGVGPELARVLAREVARWEMENGRPLAPGEGEEKSRIIHPDHCWRRRDDYVFSDRTCSLISSLITDTTLNGDDANKRPALLGPVPSQRRQTRSQQTPEERTHSSQLTEAARLEPACSVEKVEEGQGQGDDDDVEERTTGEFQ